MKAKSRLYCMTTNLKNSRTMISLRFVNITTYKSKTILKLKCQRMTQSIFITLVHKRALTQNKNTKWLHKTVIWFNILVSTVLLRHPVTKVQMKVKSKRLQILKTLGQVKSTSPNTHRIWQLQAKFYRRMPSNIKQN